MKALKALLLLSIITLTSLKEEEEKPKNGILGIDVSLYQGEIDWATVAQSGINFAIIRSTLGGGSLDEKFEQNYAGATANGLGVAVYHYSYAKTTEKAAWDANNLIDKLAGRVVPIYLDLEWDEQGALGKEAVTNIAVTFVSNCQARGYEANIYSNVNWYNNYYYPDRLREMGCKFWRARYGPNTGEYDERYKPNLGEYIWQYTSVGRVSGIGTNVDLDMGYY